MFDAFWSDFKWKIFLFCLVPYMFFFGLSFAYLSLMLFHPEESSEDWGILASDHDYLATHELPLRIILLASWLFHVSVQMKQIIADGFTHHFNQM